MPTLLTENLTELAELIGELPGGDTPAAWFCSLEPEVLKAYQDFKDDHAAWRSRMQALAEVSGLTPSDPPESLVVTGLGNDFLIGLKPPHSLTRTPRWWRVDHQGNLVPRKRTKAERNSPVNQAFQAARRIPRAVDYFDDLPNAAWTTKAAYPVHVRKPARAVLVFLAVDPADTDPPFEPGPHWIRMKLSTFHQLRERSAAAKEIP
jgi:hypothetical protein